MNGPRTCLPGVRGHATRWVLGGLLVLGATLVGAAEPCGKPEALPGAVVDGATATAEQMGQGLDLLNEYLASGKAFQACLDKHQGTDRSHDFRWDEMQNDMERTAALYNREVRCYKQRSDLAQGGQATSAAAAKLW